MKSILLKSIVVFSILASLPGISFAGSKSQPTSIPPFLLNTINMMFNISGKVKMRANIIDYATKYLGTPYRSGGMKPGGFDCSGFVRYVFSEYGFPLAHSSRTLSQEGETIKPEDARPGDLIFFASNGRVHHVGIVYSNYNKNLKMIHSSSSKGVTIDEIYSSAYWTKRLYCIKRIL